MRIELLLVTIFSLDLLRSSLYVIYSVKKIGTWPLRIKIPEQNKNFFGESGGGWGVVKM